MRVDAQPFVSLCIVAGRLLLEFLEGEDLHGKTDKILGVHVGPAFSLIVQLH